MLILYLENLYSKNTTIEIPYLTRFGCGFCFDSKNALHLHCMEADIERELNESLHFPAVMLLQHLVAAHKFYFLILFACEKRCLFSA